MHTYGRGIAELRNTVIYTIIADKNCYNIAQLKWGLVTVTVCTPPGRLLSRRLRICPTRLLIMLSNIIRIIIFFFHYDGITEEIFEQTWRNRHGSIALPSEIAHVFYMQSKEGVEDWDPIMISRSDSSSCIIFSHQDWWNGALYVNASIGKSAGALVWRFASSFCPV